MQQSGCGDIKQISYGDACLLFWSDLFRLGWTVLWQLSYAMAWSSSIESWKHEHCENKRGVTDIDELSSFGSVNDSNLRALCCT